MVKQLNILCNRLKQTFLLVISFLFIFSCSQNNLYKPDAFEKKDTLNPPVTVAAKAPVVILLDTCPPPRTVTIPTKTGGSYVIKTENGPINIPLLPPETKPADLFVPMQNYNTEHGLALSSVISSCTDKSGNLWFGTWGGGHHALSIKN